MKRRKVWIMSCDIGEALPHSPTLFVASPTSQPHSSTLSSLHLHQSPLSNPSIASSTSQLILQPYRCFTYVTGSSPTSPGTPPMFYSWEKRVVCTRVGYFCHNDHFIRLHLVLRDAGDDFLSHSTSLAKRGAQFVTRAVNGAWNAREHIAHASSTNMLHFTR